MVYLLFAFLLITVAVMLSSYAFKKSKIKKVKALREAWGKPKNDDFNFKNITAYTDNLTEAAFHTLSAQTKKDIDFETLFCAIDRTYTKVGQQFLYDSLCKPLNNIDDLNKINEQVIFFATDQVLREKVQNILQPLAKDDAYNITSLIATGLPDKPSWYKWIIVYIILVISFLIISLFHHKMWLWIMLPLAINVFFHYRTKNYTKVFKGSFPQLNNLISVCEKLQAANIPFNTEGLKNNLRNLKIMQRKATLLSYDGHTLMDEFSEIGMYFLELIKGFFLIEFFAFYGLLKDVKSKRTDIIKLFQYVGTVDRALSIANLRAGDLAFCVPEFLPEQKQLSFLKLYHPLIKDCVTNDLYLHDKSVLITGSNMSGKSTFLRSVAINSLLAQTIVTCFAKEFNTPCFKLHSSISIADDLIDGKSYYFEEVNVMGSLIAQAEHSWQNIFILDEVFKGTNTIERIASAKAILSFLNKNNNIVFVSAHDVELCAMLAPAYELYHFAEWIQGEEFSFDHKLKAGVLTHGNAIKILELHNYPDEIIRDAKIIGTHLQITRQQYVRKIPLLVSTYPVEILP